MTHRLVASLFLLIVCATFVARCDEDPTTDNSSPESTDTKLEHPADSQTAEDKDQTDASEPQTQSKPDGDDSGTPDDVSGKADEDSQASGQSTAHDHSAMDGHHDGKSKEDMTTKQENSADHPVTTMDVDKQKGQGKEPSAEGSTGSAVPVCAAAFAVVLTSACLCFLG